MSRSSAVVVGAGLAGLAAAFRLTQAGWSVTVLEAADYPGGRAASVEKQGYLIDTGATGVGDCYTEYLELLEAVGLGDRVVTASPITATLREGELFELDSRHPYWSGLTSSLFSWSSKARIPRMFGDLRRMGDDMNFQDVSRGHEYDNESAAEYARRRLNQEVLDYFVDPILRALVVARAEHVSRLEFMNALNGLFSTQLLGIRGGLSSLPRKLAEHFEVRYQTSATRVLDRSGRVEVAFRANSGETGNVRADACVVATLLPQAVSIYPECQPWVAPLHDALHYIPGICVHLGYARPTNSKAVMVLVSTQEIPDITLVWLDHNKCDDRAPAGHSLLYFYYDDAVAESAAAKRDDELVVQCAGIAEKLFPELAGQLDMNHVTRWPQAVPMPAPGIYKRMHQVRQNLDAQSTGRVQLAGDYLSCVGQNTAVVYGNRAARNLISNAERGRNAA